MSGINRVLIVGHVGKEPERKTFGNGGSVTNMTVATSDTWKDKSGGKQESTEWHNISIRPDKTQDYACNYIHKGDLVGIQGKLKTRKWQGQDGNNRYATEIIVAPFDGSITMLKSKDGKSSEDNNQSNQSYQAAKQGSPIKDDEIPF